MDSTQQKVKIFLHGYLKDLYPNVIELTGSSVKEIINGLCKQTKAFDPKLGEDRHTISVVGFRTKESIEGPLPSDTTELHLVPTLSGGKGGLLKIVVGIVFIAAVVITAGGFAAAGALISSNIFAAIAFNIGVSLVLGGLLEMLSPAPKKDGGGGAVANDPEASKYLGATQNTVKIGTRIPIGYGRFKIYGHYLSFDVDAVDVAL